MIAAPTNAETGDASSIRSGRYAAIDIGTVTCRMLVADVDERGGLHELRREYAITNLGEGVDATGSLKPEAMQRTVDAIASYQAVLDQYRPSGGRGITVVAIATSAARDACNAADFAALLDDRGIVLTIATGDQEAAWSFAGASCDFAGEDILVADVGGGSTEVIAGRADGSLVCAHSFNIGCRRVTEKFFMTDPPSEEEIARVRAWIRRDMSRYFDELRAGGFIAQRLVAIAGTATSVVSIHEHMEVYDAMRVHGTVITRTMLDGVYRQLARCTLVDRKDIVGLDPGRADVIVAGVVILQDIMELARVNSFTASEVDILHGIILYAATK